MIAQHLFDEGRPRIANVRSNKNASRKRRTATTHLRYAHLVRFVFILSLVFITLMSYLSLMANLTGINYSVARAEHERGFLADQTLRLDDRLAHLRSHERLATLAAHLGMRDPQAYAIVRLPDAPRRTVRPRLAFLTTVAGWLTVAP
ncbi:MAG: hypothetical protein M3Z14_01370 [Candidatus Eremiobacteraeota bacterium]|nr:hypothetical protein [Candidatus Eremiobacteraeota bacterium]